LKGFSNSMHVVFIQVTYSPAAQPEMYTMFRRTDRAEKNIFFRNFQKKNNLEKKGFSKKKIFFEIFFL